MEETNSKGSIGFVCAPDMSEVYCTDTSHYYKSGLISEEKISAVVFNVSSSLVTSLLAECRGISDLLGYPTMLLFPRIIEKYGTRK